MRFKWILHSLATGLISLAAAVAHAAAPVTEADQQFNRQFIETSRLLSAQQTQAQYWEYGWGSFNGAAVVYSAAAAIGENNAKKRNGNIVNAVQGLVGVGDVILRPLPAFSADTVCRELESPVECLSRKESLLRDSAERAHEPYEILPHAANAAFNAVSGLVISQIGRTNDAFVTGISGLIVGELQIWSTPRGPLHDYDQYRTQFIPVVIQDGSLDKPVMGIGMSWKL